MTGLLGGDPANIWSAKLVPRSLYVGYLDFPRSSILLTLPAVIGTPGQAYHLLPDSGSPNLSIESVLEPKAQQGNSPKYDPSQSSAAKQLAGYTYSECFGSGYCDNGVVYTDVFQVGDIAVANMPIMVETGNNHPSDGDGRRSGTLGLNFDKNGMTTAPRRLGSYFQSIMLYLDGWSFACHERVEGDADLGYDQPRSGLSTGTPLLIGASSTSATSTSPSTRATSRTAP
jgi:aspergillopepsin I